jgi:PTS system mannose-specific IID component
MTGRIRALWRLLAIQATWNFERMQGIGMGHAAEPLLEELKTGDAARQADAVVRSAEFFNCHPYLAGVALGATVRAEYEGVPGPQIVRLRTALCGPLGALGDRLFWTGVVPLMVSAACLAVVEGEGMVAIVVLLVIYNALRLATGVWALNAGLRSGIRVSSAISGSWLTRAAERVGPAAGLLVGIAIPKVAAWRGGDGPCVRRPDARDRRRGARAPIRVRGFAGSSWPGGHRADPDLRREVA